MTSRDVILSAFLAVATVALTVPQAAIGRTVVARDLQPLGDPSQKPSIDATRTSTMSGTLYSWQSMLNGVPVDSLEVVLSYGDQAAFTLSSTAFDPWMAISDPKGREYGSDDDSGPGNDAYLAFTATRSGRWTVAVSSLKDKAARGAYTLSISIKSGNIPDFLPVGGARRFGGWNLYASTSRLLVSLRDGSMAVAFPRGYNHRYARIDGIYYILWDWGAYDEDTLGSLDDRDYALAAAASAGAELSDGVYLYGGWEIFVSGNEIEITDASGWAVTYFNSRSTGIRHQGNREAIEFQGIDLGTPVVASFGSSTLSGPSPLAVVFTNTSEGGPSLSYTWDFGDGTSSTEASPTHTFSNAGTYDVTLTATNLGSSSSATSTITVTTPVIRLLARLVVGNGRASSPQIVEAGANLRFEVASFTRPDTSDLEPVRDFTWTVPARLGRVTSLGQMSVVTVAGAADSIIFRRQNVRTAFRLTVGPSTVSKITISPATANVKLGQKQQFTARALDRFNNPVTGQRFSWHVVGGIGTIDRNTGLFTSGRTAGRGFVIAGVVVSDGIIFGDNSAAATGTARIAVGGQSPVQLVLHQNAPNPFNPSTEIAFEVPTDGPVQLAIYNLVGQEVARLVDERLPAGGHRVWWDASGQPTGTYMYVLQTGVFREQRKMLLMR